MNRTEKRITIVFRGSVTLKDWLIDATIGKLNPEEVRAFAGTKPKLHKGFCSELINSFIMLCRNAMILLSHCCTC